jgi:hypothetical protein
MSKKLIYTDQASIDARIKYANELVNSLNLILTRFKSDHNIFGQSIDENFAFSLVTNPIQIYDDLLLANSNVKGVAGKQPDPGKLAALVNVDRSQFVLDMTICQPGSRNQYQKAGTMAIMKLSTADREIVRWKDETFVLDEKALNQQCEIWKTFAESPEQIAEVEYWEQLCAVLNKHLDRKERKFLDLSDVIHIAHKLGLADPMTKTGGKRFVPDYWSISKRVKLMTLVN